MWGAHWSIELEKKGIPSVFVVDEPFKIDVQITCDKEGMSLLRRVYVEHPCGNMEDDKYPAVIDQLVECITKPLSAEEISPPERKLPPRTRLVFKGDIEEVNDFFYRRGWTDGLPIIPPTEALVQKMLAGTTHPPEKIVTTIMPPETQTVTVEQVAAVGVMAGCKPTYMPVLLGIIEAFARDQFTSTVRSTSSFSFAILVNGPIGKQIGMNAGMNAMGSGTGNHANATIGRFFRLAVICLGGGKTGKSDMSSQGNPSKYSFAFAENEDKSPWEPYHVSAGFKPDQSVLSLFSGGWNHSSPFENADLERIARVIAQYDLPNGVVIIMDPMSARRHAKKGYSKQEAEKIIWQHATKTAAEFRADPFYPPFIEPVLKGRPMYGQRYLWPARYLDLPPDELVQVYPSTDVRIVVVGGETNPFTQAWHLARPATVAIDPWR